jgi:SHS2 domain-containing protein
MHPNTTSGFREIAHTADWELEVWAPDLLILLEQAALGMYGLTAAQISSQPRISRHITLQYIEPEILLIDFLNELLYLAESEELIFDHFDLQVEGDQLHANLVGTTVASMDKEIKAATYHKLDIIETNQGLLANIVFDV